VGFDQQTTGRGAREVNRKGEGTMPLYRVCVREVIFREAHIEADSEDEARELASEPETDSEFVEVDGTPLEIVSVEKIEG
jgi:hypothetical protein